LNSGNYSLYASISEEDNKPVFQPVKVNGKNVEDLVSALCSIPKLFYKKEIVVYYGSEDASSEFSLEEKERLELILGFCKQVAYKRAA
jgi:hypothetical protein